METHTQVHHVIQTDLIMYTDITHTRAGAYGSLAHIPQGWTVLSACTRVIPQGLSHQWIPRSPTPPHKHLCIESSYSQAPQQVHQPRNPEATQWPSHSLCYTDGPLLIIHQYAPTICVTMWVSPLWGCRWVTEVEWMIHRNMTETLHPSHHFDAATYTLLFVLSVGHMVIISIMLDCVLQSYIHLSIWTYGCMDG